MARNNEMRDSMRKEAYRKYGRWIYEQPIEEQLATVKLWEDNPRLREMANDNINRMSDERAREELGIAYKKGYISNDSIEKGIRNWEKRNKYSAQNLSDLYGPNEQADYKRIGVDMMIGAPNIRQELLEEYNKKIIAEKEEKKRARQDNGYNTDGNIALNKIRYYPPQFSNHYPFNAVYNDNDIMKRHILADADMQAHKAQIYPYDDKEYIKAMFGLKDAYDLEYGKPTLFYDGYDVRKNAINGVGYGYGKDGINYNPKHPVSKQAGIENSKNNNNNFDILYENGKQARKIGETGKMVAPAILLAGLGYVTNPNVASAAEEYYYDATDGWIND